MDYAVIYTRLMVRAVCRPFNPSVYMESHHLVPRSWGGTDLPSNLVLLTPREHYLAHLILYKLGNAEQIFSVECFLKDSINRHSPRFGLFRYKKWLRRAIAYQKAKNIRNQGKLRAIAAHTKQLQRLEQSYRLQLQAIEERYCANMLSAAFDEIEYENY